MLIRLQEVEVIDEDDLDIELPPIDPSLPTPTSIKWPEFESICKMTFDPVLREGMLHSHSPVWTRSLSSTGKI